MSTWLNRGPPAAWQGPEDRRRTSQKPIHLRASHTEIRTLPLGLVRRRRHGADSIGILVDPAHEGVDLPGGPSGYRRPSGEYDAEAMRAARNATQGLLIVYPLDPDYMGAEGAPAVIALSLSLPQTSDAAARWVVNGMVANG